MVPSNILQRTFRICFGQSVGTGFTADVDGKRYFVTARHVVDGIEGRSEVGIQRQDGWQNFECEVVGLGADDIDVAVLSVQHPLSPDHPISFSSNGLYLGQDVYFLGYPYGLEGTAGIAIAANFPLPLVKKAIASGFKMNGNKLEIILLDGHNNPGFSGGPVFFNHIGNEHQYGIAGVVSGFSSTLEPVLTVNGDDTEFVYSYNTGIIVATGISVVMDLIRENPVGLEL